MIKRILAKLFLLFPQKYIMFESVPDFSDNTFAVYDYLVRSNLLPEYKFIWLTHSEAQASQGAKTVLRKNSFRSKLSLLWYKSRAKALIFCNETITKARNDQISIFLCHGSKSKNTRGSYEAPKDLDYILIQADMFKEAARYGYNLSERTEMVTLGYPRNDDLLLESGINRNELFKRDFNRLIIWYPTFRQRRSEEVHTSSVTLPLLDSAQSAQKINECAAKNGVLLVVKPHFAQDTSLIKNSELSNIVLINDKFFIDNSIRSYQLLALSDALLTDYSSVYYDYLLTDKPIGLVWEDYEEYKASKGFALDPDTVYSGGEKIYNTDDFCAFIERIADGRDDLQAERRKIRDLSNVYQDAESSKRVSEFIVGLLGKA